MVIGVTKLIKLGNTALLIQQLTSFIWIKEEKISLSEELEEQSTKFTYKRHSHAEYTPPRPEGKPYFLRHDYEDLGTFCCEDTDFTPVIYRSWICKISCKFDFSIYIFVNIKKVNKISKLSLNFTCRDLGLSGFWLFGILDFGILGPTPMYMLFCRRQHHQYLIITSLTC